MSVHTFKAAGVELHETSGTADLANLLQPFRRA